MSSLAVWWLCLLFSLHIGTNHAFPNYQNAESEGIVRSKIHGTTEQQFRNDEQKFKTIISEYSSLYCKRSNDNCKVKDKQIRSNDVIISRVTTAGTNVDVSLYIRDYTDNEEAALTRDQLAMVFNAHKDDINKEYGKTIEITDPIIGAWADWKTALVVCGSVLFIALVIGAIFGYRKSKQKKYIEKAIDYSQRLSNYENVGVSNHGIMSADIGVANPKNGIMTADIGVTNPKPTESLPQSQTTKGPQTDTNKTSPMNVKDEDDNDAYEYINPNSIADKIPIVTSEKSKESLAIEDAYSVPYDTFIKKKDTTVSPVGNIQSNAETESNDTHL